MVVLCCIVVVTGFLPFPVSRSSLSSPPSQVWNWDLKHRLNLLWLPANCLRKKVQHYYDYLEILALKLPWSEIDWRTAYYLSRVQKPIPNRQIFVIARPETWCWPTQQCMAQQKTSKFLEADIGILFKLRPWNPVSTKKHLPKTMTEESLPCFHNVIGGS